MPVNWRKNLGVALSRRSHQSPTTISTLVVINKSGAVYNDGTTFLPRLLEVTPCICNITGDPSVHTYDGQQTFIIGTHEYMLTSYRNKTNNYCNFEVEVKVSKFTGGPVPSPGATFEDFIEFEMHQVSVQVLQSGHVTYHKVLTTTQPVIPLTLPSYGVVYPGLNIYRSGSKVILEHPGCGIYVYFLPAKMTSQTYIRLSGTYRTHLTGLCGDCNGIRDDWRLKSGKDVSAYPDKFLLLSNDNAVDVHSPDNPPAGPSSDEP